jgi:stalled ribosome rescue protein Dom34
MRATKQLGICMDHSSAYLMEYTSRGITTSTIESQANHQPRIENITADESRVQNREQNQLADYFKQLSEIIREYDEVVLFGPTEAKDELLNHLRENHLFDKIKIELEHEDKMTENQQQAFVKDYFNTTSNGYDKHYRMV